MVAVAEAGSFSAAAQRLHITQPALSRVIAGLESDLGVRIFERGRGGASLTDAGATAVQSARTLLRQADAVAHNLRLYQQGDAGKVAFGMGPLVGSLLLPPLSATFLRERPGLHLRAMVKSCSELLEELLHGRIELFFGGREQINPAPTLELDIIARLPIAHVVRADHPLPADRLVSGSELGNYPLLIGMEVPPDMAAGGSLACDNYHILRDTVQQSDGVWVTSPRMIHAELAAGVLRELQVSDETRIGGSDICMVQRAGFELSPGAARVLAFAREFLATGPG